MSNVVAFKPRITAMSKQAIENVRALEAISKTVEQIRIETIHAIHGGMYARTILLPAGTVLTGAHVNVPTMVIVNGDATVYANEESYRFQGHHVLPASAGRKQAYVAHENTWITMVYATAATTVEEAENELTDEPEILMSRQPGAVNHTIITGE